MLAGPVPARAGAASARGRTICRRGQSQACEKTDGVGASPIYQWDLSPGGRGSPTILGVRQSSFMTVIVGASKRSGGSPRSSHAADVTEAPVRRSEEHTSELQS